MIFIVLSASVTSIWAQFYHDRGYWALSTSGYLNSRLRDAALDVCKYWMQESIVKFTASSGVRR
jgi:hypothetical protein